MTPRHTGPTAATNAVLWERAGGRCELCDRPLRVDWFSRHHRDARGMGGTRRPWINQLTNLLLLCGTGNTGCHGRIETNRAVSYDAGWLIRGHTTDPATVPVQLARGLTFLTVDGCYQDAA